jgi:hypothetical protein
MITAYHGTNVKFSRFDRARARISNDNFGGGIYLADDIRVAKQYANAMAKKYGGERIIYKINANMQKIFDVDAEFTGKPLLKLIQGNNLEAFARYAGLLSLGVDKFKVLSGLKDGSATLYGSQIFRGLSHGMVQTAKARDRLEKLGYDGLRYNGGNVQLGATAFNAYIAYNVMDLKIQQRYIYVPKSEGINVIH